jgi:glycerophosphoryl diester phosphodiesterase
VGLAFAGVLLLVPHGPPRPPVLGEVPRPIIFAHRGGSGEAPESTLPAMLAVAARFPDAAIELDVRASRDGHIVVIHDGSVDRTTNGKGAVTEKTLAELQALDAGYCATPGRGTGTARRGRCDGPAEEFPFRGKGYRIPTLAEVLAALPPRTLLGIEVKAAGFEEPLARMLRGSGRLPRLAIGSENREVADRLRALLPEAAYFFPKWPAVRFALAAKLGGRLARPQYDVLVTPRSVVGLRLDGADVLGTAARRGLLVAYFTVNREEDMERLLRAGAGALITDYPTRAQGVLERLRTEGVRAPRPADTPAR